MEFAKDKRLGGDSAANYGGAAFCGEGEEEGDEQVKVSRWLHVRLNLLNFWLAATSHTPNSPLFHVHPASYPAPSTSRTNSHSTPWARTTTPSSAAPNSTFLARNSKSGKTSRLTRSPTATTATTTAQNHWSRSSRVWEAQGTPPKAITTTTTTRTPAGFQDRSTSRSPTLSPVDSTTLEWGQEEQGRQPRPCCRCIPMGRSPARRPFPGRRRGRLGIRYRYGRLGVA